MMAQRSGRIINITSPASRMALPNYTAYAASKAGVDAITRAAAVALAPHGVRVNSVAPGMMDTPMQRVDRSAVRALEKRDRHRAVPGRAHRAHPGRPPHSTGGGRRQAVVWLALDAPDYITAERLNVSGGLDKD